MSTLRINNPLWRFVNNPYPGPNQGWLHNHIPGKEVKDVGNITREEKQHFFPKECKTANHLLEITDFISNATDELKKTFHEKWVNDLFRKNRKEKYEDFSKVLIKEGLNPKHADATLDYAVNNTDRIKSWSYDNEKVGKRASTFMSFAIPLGIVRNIILDLDFISPIVQKTVNFLYTLTSTMRGYYQYSKHMYDRPDDEASMNRYQAEVYGNKVAGNLGTCACFMETKINPLVLSVLSLFSNDKMVLDSVGSLFTIPNISWWRARMLGHINQEYLTDLLRYILHKPLAILGNKKSEEVIEGIKERKNLKPDYVVKRHYENVGLKDKKEQKLRKFLSELAKSIKNSFHKDPKIQQESAKKAGETIAPIFGFTAFLATAIGTPLKVLLKIIDKQNRVTDFFSSLSLSCQQSIYFFKMIVPAICNIKKTKSALEEPDIDKRLSRNEIEDLKTLLTKYRKLTSMGLLTFSSSIINSVLKLFKFENPYFGKLKSIVEGLSSDLVSKFFSERRHVLGFQFKAENPEFYEDELQEDKVKEKDESAKTGEGKEKKIVIKAVRPMVMD